MKSPSGLDSKPSPTHIIWTLGDESKPNPTKRFHAAELRGWCAHYDVDYGSVRRTDRERADESRRQYRCVFNWHEGDEESFSMGDEEWSIGGAKEPESLLEVDVEGLARVCEHGTEYVLDIAEMAHRGPVLVVREVGANEVTFLDSRDLKADR